MKPEQTASEPEKKNPFASNQEAEDLIANLDDVQKPQEVIESAIIDNEKKDVAEPIPLVTKGKKAIQTTLDKVGPVVIVITALYQVVALLIATAMIVISALLYFGPGIVMSVYGELYIRLSRSYYELNLTFIRNVKLNDTIYKMCQQENSDLYPILWLNGEIFFLYGIILFIVSLLGLIALSSKNGLSGLGYCFICLVGFGFNVYLIVTYVTWIDIKVNEITANYMKKFHSFDCDECYKTQIKPPVNSSYLLTTLIALAMHTYSCCGDKSPMEMSHFSMGTNKFCCKNIAEVEKCQNAKDPTPLLTPGCGNIFKDYLWGSWMFAMAKPLFIITAIGAIVISIFALYIGLHNLFVNRKFCFKHIKREYAQRTKPKRKISLFSVAESIQNRFSVTGIQFEEDEEDEENEEKNRKLQNNSKIEESSSKRSDVDTKSTSSSLK